jgi:hypothetical protein
MYYRRFLAATIHFGRFRLLLGTIAIDILMRISPLFNWHYANIIYAVSLRMLLFGDAYGITMTPAWPTPNLPLLVTIPEYGLALLNTLTTLGSTI